MLSRCWRFCVGDTYEDTERVRVIDHSCQGLHDVPGHLFLHERTLEELILTSNRIEDLPLPLFHCHALTVLNMSQNMLSVLPNAIGSLTSLKNLDLSRNCIEVIPDDLKKCRKLVVLNLSVNPLTQFPDVVTKLISLEELYLNDIQLDYLPANTCRLVNLRILELRENRLSNLPKAIARLTHLTRLDIGLNDLYNVPEVIGNLQTLEELWMDLNYIRVIPALIGNMHKLTHLEAGDNKLVSLHDNLTRCIHLVDLTLAGCRIEAFPENLVALTDLVTLRLDRNNMKRLPAVIGRLVNLRELNVGHNSLTELPGSIGLLRKLEFLCVDSNFLEHLPKEIGSCVKLSVLSVQANNLTEIPAEVGNINSLMVLDLRNNRLRNLPMSLLKLDSLVALWLSHNQSKPMTPLIKEMDTMTNTNVLTCYLLPQEESCDNTTSKRKGDDVAGSAAPCRITFAAGSSDRPNLLIRAPTPYPKRLRELAKTARSVCQPHQYEDHEEQVKLQGRQPKCDEIRTAVVKKNDVSPVTEQQCDGTAGELKQPHRPPPYHIAAAYSKQAMMFALASPSDGQSDLADCKDLLHLQEDVIETAEVEVALEADNFVDNIEESVGNKDEKDEPEIYSTLCIIAESLHMNSEICDDNLSHSDSDVQYKRNSSCEVEDSVFTSRESVRNDSDPDVNLSDISQSSIGNASLSSSPIGASSMNYENCKGEPEMFDMSLPKSPYENISFRYSKVENSRFEIRKVKDGLPRITKDKSMIKFKKRQPSEVNDDFLNVEWDFDHSDHVTTESGVEKSTLKNNVILPKVVQIQNESPSVCYEIKPVSTSIPGPSYNSPSYSDAFLFDMNCNPYKDFPHSKQVFDNGSLSPRKLSSKCSPKTPWIFGQHKNPVVMQVEVPKLSVYNKELVLERQKYGVFVTKVGDFEPLCSVLKAGDKILEIDGIHINSFLTGDMAYEFMRNFNKPFTMLISRQT